MSNLGTVLIDRIEGKMTREPVPLDIFIESDEFAKLKPPWVWGTYSIYHVPTKHKYVDLDSWRYTTTELGRAYLRYIFEEQSSRKRVGFDRQTFKLLKISAPYYFRGYHRGTLSMVDIVECYYQLYSPLTLDMKFDPWRNYVGLGEVDFLEREWLADQRKSMRRIIGGGIIRADKLKVYNGKEIADRPNFNKLLAPELFGLMMFTLHYMAREIVGLFGAHYWNVDGCIVDSDRAASIIDYLVEEWNISAVEKLGPGIGEVRGVGSYDILPHRGGRKHKSAPKSNLSAIHYDPGIAAKLKAIRRRALA